MRKLYSFILLIGIIIMLASCSEALQEDAAANVQGTEGRVSLTLSAAPMQVGTAESRASIDESLMDEGTDGDYTVSDLWLIEYDASGAKIGSARYMTWEEYKNTPYLPIILPEKEGVEYTCVIIANTHDADAELFKQYSTLTTLTKTILSQGDLYNCASDSEEAQSGTQKKGDLLMNGFFKVNSQTDKASCTLYRNVAKLKLTIKNNTGSGIKLHTVQLKNVPNTLYYADQAVSGTADTDYTANPFPQASNAEFMELSADTLGADGKGLVAGAEEVELTYYLPRNMRGMTATTDTLARNNDVPEGATYVELMGVKVDVGGNELTPLRYRFYIGGNTTNDFNVKANYLYEIPITLNDIGNQEADSRVEDLGGCKLSANANAFVINPLGGDVQTVYELPISRVNEFWSKDNVYAKQVPDFDGRISHTTEWQVSVLWQDKAEQLIQFCDKSGKVTATTQGTYTAKGLSQNIFFKPIKGAKGNVLLGIRKKGDDRCLWSWHLWMTDYAPGTVVQKNNNNEKTVPGGRILRHDDVHGNTWWSSQPDTYIMDRNIGAETDDTAKDKNGAKQATYGLYYQWGRKDPRPRPAMQLYTMDAAGTVTAMAKQTYAVNGESITSCLPVKAGAAYFAESVMYPTTFFAPATLYEDWAKETPLSMADAWPAIFNPAPAGWKVPEKGYAKVFEDQRGLGLLTWQNGYYLYVDTEHTVKTWYAATGSLVGTSGQHYYEGSTCAQWTATRNSACNGYNIYISSGPVSDNSNNVVSRAFTLRCVKE